MPRFNSLTVQTQDVTELLRTSFHRGDMLHLEGADLHYHCQTGGLWGSLVSGVRNKQHKLTVTYTKAAELDSSYVGRVRKLTKELAAQGYTRRLHPKNGHLTWLKLPEWMQVRTQ